MNQDFLIVNSTHFPMVTDWPKMFWYNEEALVPFSFIVDKFCGMQ